MIFFQNCLFPTCQVRVVRFYVNSRSFSSFSSSSSPDLNHDDHSRVFAAGPQPRPATPSVRCRTSTTTINAQCSLPVLNHDQPRPAFAAGPQPRPATPSVRCRTSTTTSHAQCSLPDLNHDHPRPVFAAGPQLLSQKLCQIECQKTCQIECQIGCQKECQKRCQIECKKIFQIDPPGYRIQWVEAHVCRVQSAGLEVKAYTVGTQHQSLPTTKVGRSLI